MTAGEIGAGAPTLPARPRRRALRAGATTVLIVLCAAIMLMRAGAAETHAQDALESTPQAGTPVTLEAVAINGTEGASIPEGLIVTLQVFDSEDTELQRLEAEAGGDGRVSFDGVIADREVTYTLSAAHNDVRFFSVPYISTIERQGPPELLIYELTTDPSVIHIIGDSSAITPVRDDTGILRVLQVTTYENTSDRAYVGQDPLNTRLTVQLPLPAMAFDLESVHNPGSLVLAPESRDVYSIIPVMPGVEEYIVTYGVLYTTNVFAWSKTYPYPAQVVRLLVPGEITYRPGPAWVHMADSEVSGETYARYEIASLPAGETVSGVLADLPLSAGARSRSLEGTLRTAALGVVTAALIAAALAVYWTRYLRRRARPAPAVEPDLLQERREEALRELARLEDARESGEITQEEYSTTSQPHRDLLRRILDEGRTQ